MSGPDVPPRGEATVVAHTAIAPRVSLVRFRVAGDFPFAPGQYVALASRDAPAFAPRGYYSIASGPGLSQEFELCMGQPSTTFPAGLVAGQGVDLWGPLGPAIVARKEASGALIVTTGTGVALARASLLGRIWGDRPVICVVGQRSEEDLLFDAEFSGFAGVDYRPVLSRSTAAWSGRKGHVQEQVRALLQAGLELEGLDVVVCGQAAMVSEVQDLLEQTGASKTAIFAQGYE